MTTRTDAATDSRAAKKQLRRTLRKLRRNLDADERKAADRRICERIGRLGWWRRAKNVASFLAFDGEPSMAALHADRRWRNKRFHVPVIRAHRMRFAPLDTHAALGANIFGISEPRHRHRIETSRLDVVLVSLVGFDANGNRLGMGGGFYDRHFSTLINRTAWFRPRLIGVAYDFQRVDALPRDAWDVPLRGIVTDREFYSI